jgi:predicted phosphoribosyltransferase
MGGMVDIARELAAELREHEGKSGVYVIAVAPESLWLAAEVARQLRVPFDLFPIRALRGALEQGPPVGLVGAGGVLVIDQAAVLAQGGLPSDLAESAQVAARALVAFEREIRDGAEPPDVRHRTIILLDDGRTSIQILRMTIVALRRCWVKATTLAIPTIAASELALVRSDADAVVSAVVPDGTASAAASGRPEPPSVAEIRQILRRARPPTSGHGDVQRDAAQRPGQRAARLEPERRLEAQPVNARRPATATG